MIYYGVILFVLLVFIVFFNAFVVEEQVFTQVKKTSWELHFALTDNLKEKAS